MRSSVKTFIVCFCAGLSLTVWGTALVATPTPPKVQLYDCAI